MSYDLDDAVAFANGKSFAMVKNPAKDWGKTEQNIVRTRRPNKEDKSNKGKIEDEGSAVGSTDSAEVSDLKITAGGLRQD